jgi:hypothetical protein
MKTLNLNRGNETGEHIALKSGVLQFLHNWGYGVVLCEHQYCDIVAVHPHRATILGVEIERSERNALKNISRDFSQGCSQVLVVCPNLKVLGEVARKFSRALPSEFWEKTALATISALHLTRPIHFPSLEAREQENEK